MPKPFPIRGDLVDNQGRCTHYHSERDVVANWCTTCQAMWACHACHEEATDHPFGRVELSSSIPAVLCGVCGKSLSAAEYDSVSACPGCGAQFNPGCRLHRHLYFHP